MSETFTSQEVPQLHHYIVVRGDIPAGAKLAQVSHASSESALPTAPPPGTRVIVKAARHEVQLARVADELIAAGVLFASVFESDDDPQYPGQLMAIGARPTPNRELMDKLLRRYPLAR